MKSIKVDDDIHAWLKSLDGESISQSMRDIKNEVKPPVTMDKLLDQIAMLHKRFDALEDSLSSFSFSEPKEDTYLSPAEARQKEIERLRAMDEFQQNAISHPEDEVQ